MTHAWRGESRVPVPTAMLHPYLRVHAGSPVRYGRHHTAPAVPRVRDIIDVRVPEPTIPKVVAAAILAEVAAKHEITVADLSGPLRTRAAAWPRQEAMARLARELGWSMPRIGRFLGGRDHTTVLYGIRAHEKRMAEGRG